MSQGKKSIAVYSVIVGALLTTTKLLVGFFTGSLGILAEALHSFFDLSAAIMTFFSVKISSQPPDADHNYGHGKVENLSALAQGILLLVTCIWIIWEAGHKLLSGKIIVEASLWAFAVMLFSLTLDIIISRLLYWGAKEYTSQALEADGLHYASDILSSLVVLAGLIGVKIGYPILDPIAALGVSVLVLYACYKLMKDSIEDLMDKAPAGLREKILKSVEKMAGIEKVDSIKIRRGGGVVFVDIIVLAKRGISLEKSHELSLEIENEIHHLYKNSETIVHFHPSTFGENLFDTVNTVAARHLEIREVHDIQSYRNRQTGKFFLSLHAKFSSDTTLGQAHQVIDQFEAGLRKEIPDLDRVEVHIETLYTTELGFQQSLSDTDRESITREILADKNIKGIHDIRLHKKSTGSFLSCHILTEKNLNLKEVHQIATSAEDKIKKILPQILEAVVHVEPYNY
ncbi:MAG: cation diffusion facilitator family transporter [Candidatus Wallbacteria bacterium]|nr:cation diffusion facilitator family transporter [Candidatus Wallbacteria bacterium]